MDDFRRTFEIQTAEGIQISQQYIKVSSPTILKSKEFHILRQDPSLSSNRIYSRFYINPTTFRSHPGIMTSYLILALACIVPAIAQPVTTVSTTLVPSTSASATISSSSYAPTQPGLAADCKYTLFTILLVSLSRENIDPRLWN